MRKLARKIVFCDKKETIKIKNGLNNGIWAASRQFCEQFGHCCDIEQMFLIVGREHFFEQVRSFG